jgi:hypothetical protein
VTDYPRLTRCQQVTAALRLAGHGGQGCEGERFHPDLCRVDDGDSAIMYMTFGERPEGYFFSWFVNGRWAAWFGEPEAAFRDYYCIGGPFWFHFWRCARRVLRLVRLSPWKTYWALPGPFAHRLVSSILSFWV